MYTHVCVRTHTRAHTGVLYVSIYYYIDIIIYLTNIIIAYIIILTGYTYRTFVLHISRFVKKKILPLVRGSRNIKRTKADYLSSLPAPLDEWLHLR